jgi:excisionase family DNA binding protein
MTSVPALLTTSEVAKRLKVHPATVRRWVEAGSLSAITLPGGKQRRFREADVDKLLAGFDAPSTTPESVSA